MYHFDLINSPIAVSPHGSFEVKQLSESVAICEAKKGDRHNWGNATETEPAFIGESFKIKAEQVARFIRHQEALAEARKVEAKRIQTLAKQAENGAARLRKYLIDQMLRSDIKKIDGVAVKIGLRKKQPAVLLNVEPEKLPAEYVQVSYKPDLTKIRKLLKVDASGAIGWASLSESHQYSVTIR